MGQNGIVRAGGAAFCTLLKQGDVRYQSIFVGMSRVTTSEHLRLLVHSARASTGPPSLAFNYLTELTPNKNINIYNAGFDNKNGVWDWQKSLKAKF